MTWVAAALFLTIAVHLSAQPPPSTALANEPTLVARVYYNDAADLARLTNYDVWEYNNVAQRYVLAAVAGDDLDALRAAGWRVAVDETATARLADRAAKPMFFDGYRSVDELYAALDAAAAAHPELTELLTYGQSYCLASGGCVTPGGDALAGYPLRAIRVTNEAIAGSSLISGATVTRGEKPVFFLMANIHAREITTPEIALRFLDLLLDGYGTDANVTWLLDWHEIWIVPTANPDGHWLVELGEERAYGGLPFMQRKNARLGNNIDGLDDCDAWPPDGGTQFGVDLNRNHSFAWGGSGSSDEPCDPVFRGRAPASESEVARLEALLKALFADRRGPAMDDPAPADTAGLLITLHSFSNLVLWPWGHLDVAAPNKTDLQAIGDKLATFNGYRSCQAAAYDCLYAAAGATDDWAYGELGIPAFTFEMGDQFMPSYNEVDGVQWPANGPALLYAATIARAPYQLAHGPDARDVLVAGPGPVRSVSATLDATSNSGLPIAAAEYTVDVPPWQEEALPVALTATDHVFNAAVEKVVGEMNTSALPPGGHILYLRGQDSAGNWGPVSAAFITVDATPDTWLYLPSVLGP
ncbi:MAG TPA: M14 family zinc carboxypeptidase [Promineifilum sp.]|nr:M14 family zinc carboxypeptidase [Promineifilum sp.]